MILYTTDTCINCDDIKKKLDEANIEYTVSRDIEEMKRMGIKSVPKLMVEDKLLDYDGIIKYIDSKPRRLMSQAKFYEGYSRYLDDQGRYETWEESVSRVIKMHRKFYKDIMTEELDVLLKDVERGYKNKLFLGAQRALQFGGDQLLSHNARLYNCSASYCDRPEFFGELFYLLLCGAGVGFSVQKQHISKLPEIKKRKKSPKTYVVPDSIEGWADTIDILLSSYFVNGGKHPEYEGRRVYFDLTKIRPKGAFISGGFKAPGSQPLREALDKIEQLIEKELNAGNSKLRTIVAYDICMHIADAVISGGVRRSATICMFSKDDEDMIKAKTGSWFVENPQRGRSNNSVVLLRDTTTLEEFEEIIKSVRDVGEPGFLWTDSEDFVYNPCVEVGMKPQTSDGRTGFQMCNLTEINGAKSNTKEIFFEQCKLASILGTIQAGYTNFKFLSKETKEIVDREALIGVGMTGMMNNPDILFDPEITKEGARIVKEWNKKVADIIGINQASRTTVIKPSGNSAVLLECSSGVHGEHSERYFRHVQFNKDTEVAQLFMDNNPTMCEDSVWNRERDVVVAFPVESNSKSIFKSDLLGVKQLEYVRTTQQNWIEEGTNIDLCVDKRLRHNVSNTITVDDWDEVTKYIYNNRYDLCGVSLLSAVGDSAYIQAPFTEVFTHDDIVKKYGEVSLFTSALIEAGLNAFDNDLWNACNTALGFGEQLRESHDHLLKRDFVRRFNKLSLNFKSSEECAKCLKDVYNLHKWWKIKKNASAIDWENALSEKQFVDIDTMGATGCAGGKCEI